jgi:CRISPR/Cas system-associated exonuclease Cas4 (RecB family)
MNKRATPRNQPYIWATWLAKFMSGDTNCQWQFWFMANNQLRDKSLGDFNEATWTVEHTKMLNTLTKDLEADGQKPLKGYRFKIPTPSGVGLIAGRLDCHVVNDDRVCVYDCKTGAQRNEHAIQVMIYLYALSQEKAFAGKEALGYVVYKEGTIPVKCSPDLEGDIREFTDILVSALPPSKQPGRDCRFCKITTADCPSRYVTDDE